MTCKDCIHYEVCERKDGTSTYTVEDPSLNVVKEINFINCGYFKDRSKFIEQKHGFWLYEEDCYGDPIYQCSNCGMYFILVDGTPEDNEYDYCPSCGAKMDELKEKEHEKE